MFSNLHKPFRRTLLASLIATAVLAACGGSDDDNAAPPPPAAQNATAQLALLQTTEAAGQSLKLRWFAGVDIGEARNRDGVPGGGRLSGAEPSGAAAFG